MKSHCVTCDEPLRVQEGKEEEFYIKYGNFCMKCSTMIGRLAFLHPSSEFMVSDEEYKKMLPKKKEWYKKKMEEYKGKKKVYERAENKYHNSI